MPRSLLVMDALGALCLALGLPTLLDPAGIRVRLRLGDAPQMVYVLRIAGTMLSAMGLILLVFSTAYWHYSS